MDFVSMGQESGTPWGVRQGLCQLDRIKALVAWLIEMGPVYIGSSQ